MTVSRFLRARARRTQITNRVTSNTRPARTPTTTATIVVVLPLEVSPETLGLVLFPSEEDDDAVVEEPEESVPVPGPFSTPVPGWLAVEGKEVGEEVVVVEP